MKQNVKSDTYLCPLTSYVILCIHIKQFLYSSWSLLVLFVLIYDNVTGISKDTVVLEITAVLNISPCSESIQNGYIFVEQQSSLTSICLFNDGCSFLFLRYSRKKTKRFHSSISSIFANRTYSWLNYLNYMMRLSIQLLG